MDKTYFWITILALGFFTFSIRFSFIFLAGRISLSKKTKTLFSFIPAAILPALFSPMVYQHVGHVNILNGKERILAFIIAALINFKTKNILITILSGILTLFLLKLIS